MAADLTERKTPSRLPWIDYAKGLAIIFVVYRHVIGGYSNAGFHISPLLILIQQSIYNFRMPLFFILAGIFVQKSLAKRNLKEFFFYKLNSILYPYFVWCFIQVTIQILFFRYAHTRRSVTDYWYILYDPFALDDQFWFLYTIFWVSLLYAVIDVLVKGKVIYHVLLSLLFTYLATLPMIPQIEAVLYYYLFFALGSLASNKVLKLQYQEVYSSGFTVLSFLPIFILTQYYWLNNLNLRYENIWIFSLISIIGCLFVFVLSFYVSKHNWLKFLKVIGKHSLYIYIMHVIIQAGSRAILVNVLHIHVIELLLTASTILAIYLPIVFYRWTLRRGLWFLYGYTPLKTTASNA